MARPQRNNVDYFPFFCKEGKSMFYIEQKYGNDGFATWVKILRELALADYHYLNLSDEINMMYISAKCKIDKIVLENIINDLVKLGHFDSELWNENQIIFSEKFVESVSDAYKKRSNEIICKKTLLVLLISLGIRKPSKGESKPRKGQSQAPVNPQSKEEYSKEEKSKQENIKITFEEFRGLYKGNKKGLNFEFDNFKKKNDNYDEIVYLLKDAVLKEIENKESRKLKGLFVPEWKNLTTWINQKCWEQEFEKIETSNAVDYSDKTKWAKQSNGYYVSVDTFDPITKQAYLERIAK